MKILLTLPVFAFLICGMPVAAEEPKPQISTGQIFPAADDPEPGNPNHLEPISPYGSWYEDYCRTVFELLVANKPAELWMIALPRSPESAVILRLHITPPASKDPLGMASPAEWENAPRRWSLEYAEAKSHIAQWKETGDGSSEFEIRKDAEIARDEIQVSAEFAEAIIAAWTAVLKQTRYPETAHSGFDGTTYQFGFQGYYFGETWSPNRGIPLQITNFGNKLGELARSKEKDRRQLMDECLTMARELLAAATSANQARP